MNFACEVRTNVLSLSGALSCRLSTTCVLLPVKRQATAFPGPPFSLFETTSAIPPLFSESASRSGRAANTSGKMPASLQQSKTLAIHGSGLVSDCIGVLGQ